MEEAREVRRRTRSASVSGADRHCIGLEASAEQSCFERLQLRAARRRPIARTFHVRSEQRCSTRLDAAPVLGSHSCLACSTTTRALRSLTPSRARFEAETERRTEEAERDTRTFAPSIFPTRSARSPLFAFFITPRPATHVCCPVIDTSRSKEPFAIVDATAGTGEWSTRHGDGEHHLLSGWRLSGISWAHSSQTQTATCYCNLLLRCIDCASIFFFPLREICSPECIHGASCWSSAT